MDGYGFCKPHPYQSLLHSHQAVSAEFSWRLQMDGTREIGPTGRDETKARCPLFVLATFLLRFGNVSRSFFEHV